MRDFLPAALLAAVGLCVLTIATIAPVTDEPAVIFFSSDLSQTERVTRAVELGGTIVSVPTTGRTVFVTFGDFPSFQQINDFGVIAILNAVGASGCAGQRV